MKTTKYEKLIWKLTHFGRKNRFCRILVLFLLVPVMGIHHMIQSLLHNGRRITVIACAGVCFLVNASFRGYSAEPDAAVEGTDRILETEAIAEKELLKDSMDQALLDDALTEYDGEYEDEDMEIDTFTIEDILEEYPIPGGETSRSADKGKPGDETGDMSSEFSFEAGDWRYILVNKQHPIPEDYTFELATIKGSMQCDSRILEDLIRMLQAAKEDGVSLSICSPYRDMEKQIKLFDRKINQYMSRGYSYLDAYKLASQLVTVPGTSEHQLGLSIDFLSNNYRTLDYGFGKCAAGKWLFEHGYEYGFILRYPKDKETVTGIDYEPWHYRYVGVEAATVIMQNGLTLEEFVEDYLN